MRKVLLSASVVAAIAMTASSANASSHREAPFITHMPKVDNTDVYLFNSYESGREGYVTIIANYIPFQEPYGGPNYFAFDEDAAYEIHVDNNGDAVEDVTFRFLFENEYKNIALDIGGEQVPIPLINAGEIGPMAADTMNLNRLETYRIEVVRGDRRTGDRQAVTHAVAETDQDPEVFVKPVDNIGNKSIEEYAAYAQDHIYDIAVPDCNAGGRVFVGQRKESFVINAGETFDLINYDPLAAPDSETNTLEDKNITSIALELPADCLTNGSEPVIGGWATASKPQMRRLQSKPGENHPSLEQGGLRQVSRLGHPLINEVVIGLPDKDLFNSSKPVDDAQFLTYVTNPTLPALIETLFPVTAPTVFPRQDLVDVFLLGVEMLNRPMDVVPAEILRLNTSIPAVPAAEQDPLGVLGMDTAGYPNGRRPGDDVVDISLRAAMGVLLSEEQAPSGQLPYTDGAYIDATQFDEVFPYLLTPIPGSPSTAYEGEDDENGAPTP